jgi:hypothetical protein
MHHLLRSDHGFPLASAEELTAVSQAYLNPMQAVLAR